MAHDYYMLGLLFQKQDRAKEVVAYLKEVMDKIEQAVSKENKAISAVASSMTNYYSVGESDYTALIKTVGGKNPLDAGSWGGTTSIKVMDNLDVFNTDKYRYEYVIHLRAYNGYTNEADVPKLYNDYTKTIAEYWEHGLDGQYLVNANMPIPARLAYVASIFYDDIDKKWADEIHQGFVDKFFAKKNIDVSKLTFIYPAE
jgi:adenosylcobinamide amidohydrolase